MKEQKDIKSSLATTRRDFVKTAAMGAAAAAAFTIVPRHVLGKGFLAPSDTLYIAAVGVAGKGTSDIEGFLTNSKAKIAFLCDVNDLQAGPTYAKYPNAKRYADWRELFDKESKNFDAVSVSTPDHTHAVVGSAAIVLGKHIWIQKPLTHDIYEARVLADLAKKYKVVSQMGNQGASNDGTRKLKEWFEAGLIGDIQEVHAWTNRPIWPQGIKWSTKTAIPPSTLNWDLWQGTAPKKEYPASAAEGGIALVPFSWRGFWDYGTGAIGDMGAHLLEAPMNVFDLKEVLSVESSVASLFTNEESAPAASFSTLMFAATPKTKGPLKVTWSDGGIIPSRPDEIEPNEVWPTNGTLFIGTKGKMFADTYAANAKLLPVSRMDGLEIAEKYKRVPEGANGHYAQWVEASIAGYGKMEVSSPFDKAALLTEAMLLANLSIRGYTMGIEGPPMAARTGTPTAGAGGPGGFGGGGPRRLFPSRNKKLMWDYANMKVTNIPEINRFVKREYRAPWSLSGV
jgi:predicted dehydrogenase